MTSGVRRIAVIGNSHIGALKNAWKQLGDEYPGVQLTFFGAIAAEMSSLRAEGRCLVPDSESVRVSMRKTSEGQGRIPLDQFDEIIVVAMDFSIRRLLQVFRTHRFLGLEGAEKGAFWVSRQVFRLAMRDALENSVAMQTIAKIRSIDAGKPVTLVPQPFGRVPAEVVVNDETVGFGMSSADAVVLRAMFDDVCRELAAQAGVLLHPQAEDTVYRLIWTQERFGAQKANVNGGPVLKEDDTEHMGAEYGVSVLRSFLAPAPA